MTSKMMGLLALIASTGACANFERGPRTTTDGGDLDAGAAGDVGTLSFAAVVNQLLVPTCQRCHSSGQEAGDTALLLAGDAPADYAVVTPFIDIAAPASSRLLAKMSGQGHGGGTVYAADSPAYQTILNWIQQGARP
jgi:hypothetical protein